jgi:hypothetical protein
MLRGYLSKTAPAGRETGVSGNIDFMTVYRGMACPYTGFRQNRQPQILLKTIFSVFYDFIRQVS